MKRFIHLSWVLLLGTYITAHASSLSVTASVQIKESGKPEIKFRLTSRAGENIENAFLPWFTPPELTFVVLPVGGGAPLRRIYVPRSPVFGTTRLDANVPHEGIMELESNFPEIAAARLKSDLIFFWHWSPPQSGLKSTNSGGLGGWVIIPAGLNKEAANGPN